MWLSVAVVVCAFLSSRITSSHAQVVPPLSKVRVAVVDQSGAAIDDCEVVFKSDSGTVVSHTSKDGPSTTIGLQSGWYVVTVSKSGFVKTEIRDFQVLPPAVDELKFVLKVDPDFCSRSACICSGPTCGGAMVPLATSDLPSDIASEPSHLSPTHGNAFTSGSVPHRSCSSWRKIPMTYSVPTFELPDR